MESSEIPPPTTLPPPTRPEWGATIRQIGRHIFSMRNILGLSQDKLAKLCGVSQGAVSRVETGHCEKIPLHTFVKISTYLTTEIELLGIDMSATMIGLTRGLQGLFLDPTVVVSDNVNLVKLLGIFHGLTDSQQDRFIRAILPLAALMKDAD